MMAEGCVPTRDTARRVSQEHVRIEYFTDWAGALEGAGLGEQKEA
jgi:hypothetical protein